MEDYELKKKILAITNQNRQGVKFSDLRKFLKQYDIKFNSWISAIKKIGENADKIRPKNELEYRIETASPNMFKESIISNKKITAITFNAIRTPTTYDYLKALYQAYNLYADKRNPGITLKILQNNEITKIYLKPQTISLEDFIKKYIEEEDVQENSFTTTIKSDIKGENYESIEYENAAIDLTSFTLTYYNPVGGFTLKKGAIVKKNGLLLHNYQKHKKEENECFFYLMYRSGITKLKPLKIKKLLKTNNIDFTQGVKLEDITKIEEILGLSINIVYESVFYPIFKEEEEQEFEEALKKPVVEVGYTRNYLYKSTKEHYKIFGEVNLALIDSHYYLVEDNHCKYHAHQFGIFKEKKPSLKKMKESINKYGLRIRMKEKTKKEKTKKEKTKKEKIIKKRYYIGFDYETTYEPYLKPYSISFACFNEDFERIELNTIVNTPEGRKEIKADVITDVAPNANSLMIAMVDLTERYPNSEFILCAYNGSRFDNFVLIEELQEKRLLYNKSIFIAGNSILRIQFNINTCNFRTFDLARYLFGSLAGNAKNFKCGYQKGELDHTEFQQLRFKYSTQQEFCDHILSDNEIYKKLKEYNELDVLTMMEMHKKFKESVLNLFHNPDYKIGLWRSASFFVAKNTSFLHIFYAQKIIERRNWLREIKDKTVFEVYALEEIEETIKIINEKTEKEYIKYTEKSQENARNILNKEDVEIYDILLNQDAVKVVNSFTVEQIDEMMAVFYRIEYEKPENETELPNLFRVDEGLKKCLDKIAKKIKTFDEGHKLNNIDNYMTIGSMGYNIWKKNLDFAIYAPENQEDYDFIRKAVYAGRSQIFQKGYFEGVFNPQDIASLYPFVMLAGEYPVGEYIKVNEFQKTGMGIYECEIEQKHINEGFFSQIIPKREKDKALDWGSRDKMVVNLTSVDILQLHEYHGEKSCIVKSGIHWEKTSKSVFKNFLKPLVKEKGRQDKMSQEKSEEYNPAMREACKLFMNSLSGKVIQRNFTSNTTIVNENGLDSFMARNKDVIIDSLGNNLYFLKGDKKQVVYNKFNTHPLQLGVFIYAHARKHMYDTVISKFTNQDTANKYQKYCMDTDSLHIKWDKENIDFLLDNSVKRFTGKIGQIFLANKVNPDFTTKEFGMFESELNFITERAYFIAPKFYAYFGNGNSKIRTKGIGRRDKLISIETISKYFSEIEIKEKKIKLKKSENLITVLFNNLDIKIQAEIYNNADLALTETLFKQLLDKNEAFLLCSQIKKVILDKKNLKSDKISLRLKQCFMIKKVKY